MLFCSLTSDTTDPNKVDHQSEAEKQNLASSSVQVDSQCPSKVIQEVTVGNENGNGSQYHGNCAGGSHTTENGQVGDESGENEDQRPLLQVDKEEGETGIINVKNYFPLVLIVKPE